MGLLKFILGVIIVYYVFKLAFRFLLPVFIKNQVKKMNQQQEQARWSNKNQQKQQEGKVTIEYAPSGKNEKRRDNQTQHGEYVDYEELE